MSDNVVYSDSNQEKLVLRYIERNRRLPPQYCTTIMIVMGAEKSGKHLIMQKSMTGDNLYQAEQSLFDNARLLMGQKRRKAKDVLNSLDYVLAAAEQMSFNLNNDEHPYASKFEKLLLRMYEMRQPLGKALQQNPEITLEEAAKEDVRISDTVEVGYRMHAEEVEPMVKQMLEKNPEFRDKLEERFLIDLFVNLPMIMPQQLKARDYPSDMQPPIEGQSPEEYLKSILS